MDALVRPRRSSAETREHVLAVAANLFYWRGVRATGVDAVAREAGIAPTTLYRLFSAKDDLVAAHVTRAATAYRSRFDTAVKAADGDPRAGIVAIFDALVLEVDPRECRGCLFMLVLTESPDADLPAHRGVVELKGWVRRRLGELTGTLALDEKDAETLADELTLVMEGVYAQVQVRRDVQPAVRARALVERLLVGYLAE